MAVERAGSAGLVGRTLSGKFKVERLLGEGGMGAVYVAEHVFTRRKGALKLLHRSFSELEEIVERFIREASAAGVIGSPHIVQTYDAGKLDTGEPYMFMELLDGAAVDQILEHRQRLDFEEAADIACQAAEGLVAAHGAGIVHRDIKPANLFVVRGERPFVKLLDFGISKFAPTYHGDHQLTAEGSLMGTPTYMPPEQVNGQRDIDHRADVYALGVVLYEMVVGAPPFGAETLMELSVRIHEGKYVPVTQVRSEVPPELEAVVARAMAVERSVRYQTAREFATALRPFCGTRVNSGNSVSSSIPVRVHVGSQRVSGTGPTVSGAPAADHPPTDLVNDATLPPPLSEASPKEAGVDLESSSTAAIGDVALQQRKRGRLGLILAAAAVVGGGLVTIALRDSDPETPVESAPGTTASTDDHLSGPAATPSVLGDLDETAADISPASAAEVADHLDAATPSVGPTSPRVGARQAPGADKHEPAKKASATPRTAPAVRGTAPAPSQSSPSVVERDGLSSENPFE